MTVALKAGMSTRTHGLEQLVFEFHESTSVRMNNLIKCIRRQVFRLQIGIVKDVVYDCVRGQLKDDIPVQFAYSSKTPNALNVIYLQPNST